MKGTKNPTTYAAKAYLKGGETKQQTRMVPGLAKMWAAEMDAVAFELARRDGESGAVTRMCYVKTTVGLFNRVPERHMVARIREERMAQ